MFSTTTSPRCPRRTARRLGLVLGAGIATSFALTGVAQAHVEVQPASVPGGGFSVIAFRVPNESDYGQHRRHEGVAAEEPADR